MRSLLYATVGLAVAVTPTSPLQAQEAQWRVLVFSRTTGFRHDSIPAGIAAVQSLGAEAGFAVDASEDPTVFTPATLAGYDAVVWLNTTGTVLDALQKDAFAAYVEAGGGYVGVHSAADTEYDWPFYGELLAGAWFASHPAIQTASLQVDDAAHPAVAGLPARFDMVDEWYNFGRNPRGDAQVLLTLDETRYAPGGGAMGADHPIAWARSIGNGRAFYTGLGHRSETFADARMRSHLAGAIRWASARDDAPLVFLDGFEMHGQGILRAICDAHRANPVQHGAEE